jgi:cell wall-associated NlpC family hydrolase
MVAAAHVPGQSAPRSGPSPAPVRIAAVAPAVPAPPPVPPPAPPPAARRPPPAPVGQRVVDWALTQRGVPYVYAGNGPWGYDCSGLARTAWRTVGVELPRVAAAQFDAGPHVPLSQAQPGDLVFYGGSWGIFHVAIYLGGGMMVEAPHSGGVVQVAPLDTDGTPLSVVTRPAG